MDTFLHISDSILNICEGKFNLGSSCVQAIIMDAFNLLLVLVLCLVLLTSLVRKHTGTIHCWKDCFTKTVGIACVVVSIVYFSAGFFKLSGNNGSFVSLDHISCFIRGVVWIALSVSLFMQGSTWIKVVVSVWWIIYFCLASALNIEILMKTQHIEIFDWVVWFVNSLLLICAYKNFSNILSHSTSVNTASESESEPLLRKKDNKKLTGLDHASFFSKLIFSWLNPLLHLGYSRSLELNDIPSLGSEDEANLAYEKFEHEWCSHQTRKDDIEGNNLVFRVIAKLYWKEMVILGVLLLLRVISVVVIPLLLFAFVNYSNSDYRHINQGLGIVGYLILAKVTDMFSYRQFFFYSRRIGLRIRSSLMVATYQKLLKLSSLGKQRHSTGEVVNYIAVDAYRMGDFPMWFHIVWSSGLQVLLSILILFGIVGIGVLPGLLPLVICGFLNVPLAKTLQKCQTEFMVAQDKRLRTMSEILNNIKVIKLQSWEEKFKNLVESYRQSEFEWLAKSQYKKSYNTILYWMSPTIVSSVIFFGCILLKSAPLDAATIFTILAALRTMSEPVRMIPEALSILIQVKVSFDRINSFLLEDDIKKETLTISSSSESDLIIQIEDGYFSWDPNSNTPTMSNIHLQVRKGKKIAVCGPVGAGKSSILYAILGEIPKKSGMVKVNGSFAYVSQASWIQSGTIRDNILYGKPLNRIKYEEAIRVSALDKDIESFKHGDLTEIGQRGLNLSGGQKQRVQLARAVYSDADIYLLDDPFSAVDAHTSASLFHDCVMDALAQKTVILVTHQVEFLPMVDHILVMEGGKVTQSGNYNELLMTGTAFEQLVVAHRESMTLSDQKDHEIEQEHRYTRQESGENNNFVKQSSEVDISLTPVFQLTEEEEKETGDIGLKAFSDYVTVSKGFGYLSWTIIANIGFVVLQAVASYWLAFAIQSSRISNIMIVSVYTAISTLSALFVYLRTLSAVVLGLKASNSFFSAFTDSVFKAPMLFFDSTPVGRILTRASSDLSILDFDIPYSFAFVIAGSIEIVATIAIMASVTWQVLIVGIFATVASKYVQGYYQSSARELIRINGTTKAPIMNYTAETALGVATVRAFKTEDRFFHNYIKLVDADAKVFLYSTAAMEWLVLRTEVLQNLTLFTAAFLLVLLPKGYVAPGLVGLSLSYAFALAGTQVFFSRWYSFLLNYLISVERIKQFMHIPSEPPAVMQDNRPPSSWPSNGRIELQNLKIRYRPNAPIVLKGITCTFMEGNRVGVVGRTGSGKTTLISALFRLVDPYSGRIILDGIDICSIGLKDLRLKLSIIPQDPTLFRGSIRTNLDPLGLYTDEDIWKALEKCQLKETIIRLPNLLDSSVSDEGENWSMGQRQLFCLGRVLLKRNKILVLDEATASIDSATDAILQKLIREEFSNCTVITVAHRVPTVIDSDMVMVLSFGKLVEYDKPERLMETNSSFSKLVAEYWSSCRNNSIQQFDK